MKQILHRIRILPLVAALISMPLWLMAQDLNVSGTVLDGNGDPVVGASVVVKGTTNGVTTGINGDYNISAPADAALVFSFLGMGTLEEAVSGRGRVDVKMGGSDQAIEEVVVVGYGTQKKINLTGAVTQISSEVFESRPVTNTANALQGVMSGVQITPGTGAPNTDLGINIRGTTSVNGGSPLVLVDGIESSLRMLNPADIASVTVLKDAAASAIYGVRAAFGVVLITTKRGKEGKLQVNYSNNFGWSKATILPEYVDNSYDHVIYTNEANAQGGRSKAYSDARVAAIKAYYEDPVNSPSYIFDSGRYFQAGYINWMDLLIRDYTPRQTHNVNISGGSGKTTFYTSLSYHNQEGVIKINPDIYDRYNAALSVDNQSYDWLKIGVTTKYNFSNNDAPVDYANNIWRALAFSSPVNGGQWWGDPKYQQYDQYIGKYFEDQNQVPALLYGGRATQENHEVILTPAIDIMPAKGLVVHADYNFSRRFNTDTRDNKWIGDYLINNTNNGIEPKWANQAAANAQYQDYYSITQSQTNYYSFNAYAEYSREWGRHHLKAMAGYNQELRQYNYHSARRNTMIDPGTPSLSNGTGDQTVSQNMYELALRGAFARLNYDYAERYLLEVVGRYDGTSRFPPSDRFVFLPSVSAGWRLSEEPFMEFAKPVFDNIKFRVSYGTLGNQSLGGLGLGGNMDYYPYIGSIGSGTSSSYLFNGDNTQKTINPPTTLAMTSLTWEKVSTLNFALELAFLRNRLRAEFEVYNRATKDMLMAQSYPEVLGVSAPRVNSGDLETKGWELNVGYKDRIGGLTYSIGFNLWDYTAKITKWTGTQATTVGSNYEGKELGEIWGYETAGFLQPSDFVDGDITKALLIPQSGISQSGWKDGDIKYADLNGDGVINNGKNSLDDHGDLKVIGNSTPHYQYGISGEVAWKGLYLSFFFQGVGKRDFWNGTEEFFPMGTEYYNTQKWWFENSWSPQNPDAYFARVRSRDSRNRQTQTRYLQDASYLRLKNLTIGYELPAALVSRVFLSKASVYLSGENLWEVSRMKGPYDPESVYGGNTIGTGSYGYPFSRIYSVGLNLTF